MKKNKKITLTLNKKTISKLDAQKVGGGVTTLPPSWGCSLAGGCGTGQPAPTTKSKCCYL